MGDIHGAYRAMLQCFERAAFNYETDQLIQLGDVADGYEEVFECVEDLLKLRNLVAIKGNHDEWFNQFCKTGYHEQHWSQGGRGTVNAYCKHAGKKPNFIKSTFFGFNVNIDPADVPETHKKFFAEQRPFYVDEEKNCFVHAGFNRYQPFHEQREETYYWDRSLIIDAVEFEHLKQRIPDIEFEVATPFRKIYIGHTSTLIWKSELPVYAANVVNMDTGAGWGGRLSLLNVDTGELFQSDPVTDLYGYRGR